MVKRAKQLTVALVVACSLVGAAPAAAAYAEEGGQSELHRRRPARPDAPPPGPPGLRRRVENDAPDRPPQAETPEIGPKDE